MSQPRFGGMATCKHSGKSLPANLYSDPKGRRGVYRYRQEDGSFTQVNLPYARACAAAKRANAKRKAPDGSLVYWVEQFRQWQLDREPELSDKRGWRDRQRQLERFAEDWNHLKPTQLSVPHLSDWWDSLTYDQQHNRRSHFSKFCQWGMGKGVTRSNPFSKYDNVERLLEKPKPAKQRSALSLPEFWEIYELAEPHIQIGMLISLTTTMREGDIVALRFDDIEDGHLCRTISKSLNQRGASAAAHLKWSLDEHEDLKAAIDAARELSMRHRRCPYIVSRPRQRAAVKPAAGLTHMHQCKPEHLSRGFKDARDALGKWEVDGPTFHEIRGLTITLLLQKGIDISAVQKLAAHTSPVTTSAYSAGQAPQYMNMAGMAVSTTVQD